jgi:hypothetical protein
VPKIRSVAFQILLHPLATAEELFERGPAQLTELEDVTLADAGGRPPEVALREDDRGVLREVLLQETLEGFAEPQALEAEVSHTPRHEAFLVRVQHLVQRQIGVRVEQGPEARVQAARQSVSSARFNTCGGFSLSPKPGRSGAWTR